MNRILKRKKEIYVTMVNYAEDKGTTHKTVKLRSGGANAKVRPPKKILSEVLSIQHATGKEEKGERH